jgi:hypothetical protein
MPPKIKEKEGDVVKVKKEKTVKVKVEPSFDKPIKKTKTKRSKDKVDAPKPPFSVYYSHTNPHPKKYIGQEGKEEINCLVIDPGSVNCGFFMFSFTPDGKKIFPLSVKRLQFREKGVRDENMHFTESIKIFDGLSQYIEKCHYIIIESQIGFAYNNIRISQHFISYFMTRYKDKGNFPLIVELNSKDKIRLLGCKERKKDDYKKWSVERASKFLKEEFIFNQECIDAFEEGKQDDKADSICMGFVFTKYLNDNITGEKFFKINLPE